MSGYHVARAPREASITTAPMELYVDAASGSDSGSGTQADPLASLVEAERRIPDIVAHHVLIHVAPHTGDGYAPPTFRSRVLRADIDVIADSGGTRGDGFNELYVGTAQAGSSHAKVVAPAGLGADTFRGKTIEMVTGSEATFRRTISFNTDTDIVPCLCWQAGLITAGDTFRIVEPVTALDLTSQPGGGEVKWEITQGVPQPTNLSFDGDNREIPGVNFVNFKLNASPAFTTYGFIGTTVRFHGCEAVAPVGFVLMGGSIMAGISHVEANLEHTGSEWERVGSGPRCTGVNVCSWVGWGLVVKGGFLGLAKPMSAWLYTVVAPTLIALGGRTRVRGCNIYSGGATLHGQGPNGHSFLEVDAKTYLPDSVARVTNATGVGLSVNGQGAIAEFGTVNVTASTVGVSCADAACVKIIRKVTVVAVTGVKATQGARAHLRQNSITFTVSGNQLEAGSNPGVTGTFAGLATSGAFIGEADGSVIQRVQ